MTRSTCVVLAALLAACDPPPTTTPPPPNPPQVFLTVTESNVIGDAVKGKVNVSGCKTVAQVQLLHQDTFLMEVPFTKSPTDFSLPPGTFSNLYSQLGIAVPLTLKAKVVCDDARTNTSQPVGVKFFPIASRLRSPDGAQFVPDNFIAEGGLGSSANTFLGCVAAPTGTTIARVNTRGEVVAFLASMPFNCSLATQISERSAVTGTRWVFEPGAGVFAIDSNLTRLRTYIGPTVKRIGVGKRGSAVIWVDDESTRNRIQKLDPMPGSTNEWEQPFIGIMSADPLIDDGGTTPSVWVMRWLFDTGTKKADLVPWQHDLNNGQLLNGVQQIGGVPAVMLTQQFPLDETSQPIVPQGVFSPDGRFYTVPLISLSGQTSTIIACSTAPSSGLCEGSSRRWTSPLLSGYFRLVVPFSQGNLVAVVSPQAVYFLNNQLGSIVNLGEAPLQPTGSLKVLGVQPGLDTDFYVFTGPDFGATLSYPMEIIATDAPGAGELWRLEYGSGESSGNGLFLAIDEGRQVWIRAGTDLIKPLPNVEYRMARGATMVP